MSEPQVRPPRVPQTIVFGTKPPKLCLEVGQKGFQTYFCAANDNLRLFYDKDFIEGTYTMGRFLGSMCEKHCRPERQAIGRPCPAFVENWRMGAKNHQLADVTLRRKPEWSECLGVQHILAHCDTDDERDFMTMTWDWCALSNSEADLLAERWNASWSRIPGSSWLPRRNKFDALMWATRRYPALIPQVWLNWLGDASDEKRTKLDSEPSRVDFVAFSCGERFVIEIDGPSHYADFDGRSYLVNEKAAARTLKYDRSLKRLGWEPIHLARIEVRDAVATKNAWPIMSVLDFKEVGHPPQPDDFGIEAMGSMDYDCLIPF